MITLQNIKDTILKPFVKEPYVDYRTWRWAEGMAGKVLEMVGPCNPKEPISLWQVNNRYNYESVQYILENLRKGNTCYSEDVYAAQIRFFTEGESMFKNFQMGFAYAQTIIEGRVKSH